MPKVPVDYSKTCIYKLVHFDDLNDENIYIGHTTNMTKRRWEHNGGCNNPNRIDYNQKKYKFIRENGGWDNWQMILVEKYPCSDVHEAIARERYWKRELNARLNTYEPGRTRNEWFEDNKDKFAEYNKEYYEDNRDTILEKKKEYRKVNKKRLAEKEKEYRENNRDKLLEKKNEYYHNNSEKLNEKKKEKITCNCGSVIRKDSMPDHLKTIKHQEWLKNNNLCTN